MKHKVLKVHPEDNVLVALTDLKKGEVISFEGKDYELIEDIKQKHKFTIEDVTEGGIITMYGVPVGKAAQLVPKGAMINTFNVKHYASEFGKKQTQKSWTAPDTSNFSSKTFNGYYRSNGEVGTANYWLLIPLVFCENRNINAIAEIMSEELGYSKGRDYKINIKTLIEQYEAGASIDALSNKSLLLSPEQQQKNRTFPNVDGIKMLTHEGGCGGTRMDAETLCGLLAGYVTNPNVAGATILSLGCQNAQPEIIEKEILKRDPDFDKPIFLLEQQKSESEADMIAEAVKKTFTGLIEANANERKPAPLSKLKVGLECGGSDGFSGITANPAVGYTSDLVVALGGQ